MQHYFPPLSTWQNPLSEGTTYLCSKCSLVLLCSFHLYFPTALGRVQISLGIYASFTIWWWIPFHPQGIFHNAIVNRDRIFIALVWVLDYISQCIWVWILVGHVLHFQFWSFDKIRLISHKTKNHSLFHLTV